MQDNYTHTDSMDLNEIVRAMEEQPTKVYEAEKAAAHGKYVLSLAKNIYEREFNKHYLAEQAGKTVKDKEAYALQQVHEQSSEDLKAFLSILDVSAGEVLMTRSLSVEELLRMIELKSSELFAQYHLEQNKLDVYRQKASLLKELINSKVWKVARIL